MAFLETLGLVHTRTQPRQPSALDIADFELVESDPEYNGGLGLPPTENLERDVDRAHRRVASCLRYILTGIDPDENTRSMTKEQLTELRILARKGGYSVAPGAATITDILQDAWARRTDASYPEIT
ncbi:hypothetical protein F5Y05DRAFT_409902 [Hypoxylon sp. FL0543]|nr:hypothetical protein F5Y05DRAFT_409902 [Hypoxylon sp. FL0543]